MIPGRIVLPVQSTNSSSALCDPCPPSVTEATRPPSMTTSRVPGRNRVPSKTVAWVRTVTMDVLLIVESQAGDRVRLGCRVRAGERSWGARRPKSRSMSSTSITDADRRARSSPGPLRQFRVAVSVPGEAAGEDGGGHAASPTVAVALGRSLPVLDRQPHGREPAHSPQRAHSIDEDSAAALPLVLGKDGDGQLGDVGGDPTVAGERRAFSTVCGRPGLG